MKRTLLLSCLTLILALPSIAQSIKHVDYGSEGLIIGMEESYSMDIDNDEVIDFYLNTYPGELDFTPIFAIGCFASRSYSEVTPWGSGVVQIFEEGEVLRIDGDNMYDYIDEGRGTLYKSGIGLVEGWEDAKETYIGFAVFNWLGEVSNGWMKVKIDLENEKLIILEYAYHEFAAGIGIESIIVGDRGLVGIQNLDGVLSDIKLTPNPAQEVFEVNYHYQGQDKIQIIVYDQLGKEVTRSMGSNNDKNVFDASTWTEGVYFVSFKTTEGIHTERIMINH